MPRIKQELHILILLIVWNLIFHLSNANEKQKSIFYYLLIKCESIKN